MNFNLSRIPLRVHKESEITMKHLRNDSGSVIVFVTLVVVLLLIMVAMGLDTGWLTFSRSMGQRAVDMAALAGAAGVAAGDADVVEKNIEALNSANDYVKAGGNPIDGSTAGKNVMLVKYDAVTGTITPEADITKANGVRVALETTNPYTNAGSSSAINTSHFLMPLLNFLGIGTPTSTNINVSAVAVYSTIPGIPLALGGCEYNPLPAQIDFDQAPSSPGGNNSGWTTYTEKETNTPDIIARIKAIASCQGGGSVGIGTPICMGNGTQPPVLEAFKELADPTGSKCYFAPVVDPVLVFNQCDQPIQKWAKICIRAVCVWPDSQNDPNCGDQTPGKKYIVADVQSCNVSDYDRVGVCFTCRLVRETKVGM
ncbi:MAG TPA: pilus assembly protein TadG-related protein [Candidatus Binatia bacterium]|nr:pilus assembly protein TadG-related protein [Candidatus Binatia bacterium]